MRRHAILWVGGGYVSTYIWNPFFFFDHRGACDLGGGQHIHGNIRYMLCAITFVSFLRRVREIST